jgi:hypothetical protein
MGCQRQPSRQTPLQRHLSLASLRSMPKALLQLMRDRWCLERWHWLTGTQLHEDGHRHGGPGAAVLALAGIRPGWVT